MHNTDLFATVAAADNPLPFAQPQPNRHHTNNNHGDATVAANEPNATSAATLTLFFSGNTRETLDHLLFIVLAYVIVCLGFYHLIFASYARGAKFLHRYRFPVAKRVLIVTAHPDDECMFFGPTILSLVARRCCQVYLLCLSNGNFDQKGHVRKEELWNACQVLRMKSENITLINATNLLDDPNVTWNPETIARIVSHAVDSLDIEAVITFDQDGVSHHPNHCAIFYATASLFMSGLLPKKCKVFTLDSTNMFRKYIFVLDLVLTRLMSNHWFIVDWQHHKVLQMAMEQHRSQMVWFRRLYIRCSRYMLINSLREMVTSDMELEMQIAET